MGEVIKRVSENILISPSICAEFIASEYGIKVKVNLVEGMPAIKFYNHLSLFSMINKVRREFDFKVIHSRQKNEYILIIGARQWAKQ